MISAIEAFSSLVAITAVVTPTDAALEGSKAAFAFSVVIADDANSEFAVEFIVSLHSRTEFSMDSTRA